MGVWKSIVTSAAAALALSGVAFASEANAKADLSQRAATVRFDPDRLSDPAAIDVLHRDMVRAAQRLCGDGQLANAAGPRNRCVRRAVDAAVARSEIAGLSVLHANLQDSSRYRSWRRQPDATVMALVASASAMAANDARETGSGSSAGEIYQPTTR